MKPVKQNCPVRDTYILDPRDCVEWFSNITCLCAYTYYVVLDVLIFRTEIGVTGLRYKDFYTFSIQCWNIFSIFFNEPFLYFGNKNSEKSWLRPQVLKEWGN